MLRILYDSKDTHYKEPFGTVVPGECVRITIHIPHYCNTRHVRLVLNRENGAEYASYVLEHCDNDMDYAYYTVSFALPKPGLFFYYFHIITENEAFSLYKEGYDQTNMEAGELWQLSCIPADFYVPERFDGAVMYQIFPDRFYRDELCDTKGKLTPFWIHDDIKDIPYYKPDEKGEVLNCDFFGGNLAGIASKLDYLNDLGVGVIYLNPIFKAWSNHRYDTADYHKIDELLGTEEDFSRLCRLAHERGIKIILDGVFSHTGNNSKYFDVNDIFGNGAYHHPDSPYRSWYDFQEYPDRYTSWWGIKTLPCVRELDENYLDYIIEGEDSVIAHWLRAGADGLRLDVADELPDEFIARLRARLKEVKPDALLIGEVWEDASNKISYSARRKYFTGGELDSVMNYPFRTAIIEYVCGRDGGYGLRDTVMNIVENYPPQVINVLMNILSTHDTPRILSELSPGIVPVDKDQRAVFRMNEYERETAVSRLKVAVFLQFILPGMPCIYYGDEIGTEGYEDPFCRSFFDWDNVNGNPIREFYKKISGIRGEESALRKGSVNVKTDGFGRLFISRKLAEESIYAVVNTGEPFPMKCRGNVLLSVNCEVQGKDDVLVGHMGVYLEK